MKLIITFISLLLTFSLNAQTNKRLYKIYLFSEHYDIDSCTIEIDKSYGFKEIDYMGAATRRKTKHNDKVEKLLLRRNGGDWKKNYIADLEKCKAK